MFPILKLPAELRAIVFASAPEQQDLAHLTLSCRVVHEETQHLLYRSPKLEGLPAFFSFERTLADSPHLARSIVRLCYVLEGFKPNSGSSGCPAGPCNTMGRSPRIMRIIDGLSCLNEVEFLTRGPTYDAGIFVTRFAPARYRLHTLWAMLFWTAVGRHELLGVDNVSSAPPIHISKCTLDFGRDDNFNCWQLSFALQQITVHPVLEDLTLVNVDFTDTRAPMLPATHTSLTPLTRLCLARCEIDTHWLFLTLGNVEALSRFEASCTESIWNGWDTAGGRTEGKGRWADVTQALLAHRDSLKHVELTAMSRHTTIPDLEVSINLASFKSLQTLTRDQSVDIAPVGKDVRLEMISAAGSRLQDELSLARRLDSR